MDSFAISLLITSRITYSPAFSAETQTHRHTCSLDISKGTCRRVLKCIWSEYIAHHIHSAGLLKTRPPSPGSLNFSGLVNDTLNFPSFLRQKHMYVYTVYVCVYKLRVLYTEKFFLTSFHFKHKICVILPSQYTLTLSVLSKPTAACLTHTLIMPG